MTRYLFIAAIFLALGSWWIFKVVPAAQDSTIEAPLATSTVQVSQWQWEFEPAGETAEGMPKTNVTLRNGGTSYAIGTMEGTCFDVVQSNWQLLTDQGELAAAICWWAGGGTEIGIFSEGGRAVIKLGDVDEGTAEEPGVRGNFRPLFAIDFGYVRALDLVKKTVLFDNALWLTGKSGEDTAIDAGLCTEATRSDCLPNDFYIFNESTIVTSIPLASNLTVYMLTWNAGSEGVKRQFIKRDEFAALINDPSQHWNQLPYNVTVKDGEAIMIEEVYIP